MVHVAVSQNGLALAEASPVFRSERPIALAAVSQCAGAGAFANAGVVWTFPKMASFWSLDFLGFVHERSQKSYKHHETHYKLLKTP